MESYLPACIIAIVNAYYYPKRKYKCVKRMHSNAQYWTEIGGLCQDLEICGIYLEGKRNVLQGELLMHDERDGSVLLKRKDTIVYATLYPKMTERVVAHYTHSHIECFFEENVLHFPAIGSSCFSSNIDELIWCVARHAEARVYRIVFSKQTVELIYVTDHDIGIVLCSNNTYVIALQNSTVIRDKSGQCHEITRATTFDIEDDLVVIGDANIVKWFVGGKKIAKLKFEANEFIVVIKLHDRYTYIWFFDRLEIWLHEPMYKYSQMKMPLASFDPHFTTRGFMVHSDSAQFYFE